MAFVTPSYSRARVDRAGEAIKRGAATTEDLEVLDNWRAAHLHILNTFQSNLRAKKRKLGANSTIAQRLKRKPTIIDKLSREPEMLLSRMHDIAGCRIIFDNIQDLTSFRDRFLQSRAKHKTVGGKEKYNYIASPKPSGYRGIHDVYKYTAYSPRASNWNNLRIELQYRTLTQHAWATSVEIIDIVNVMRLKFNEGEAGVRRQFLLASEFLSRVHEGVPGYCASEDAASLLEEFQDLERRYNTISRLRELSSAEFGRFARNSRFFVLINFYEPEKHGGPLSAYGFQRHKFAVRRYEELEKEFQGEADVVLVGASERDAVRLAYTNYFSDASMFLEYLDYATQQLGLPYIVGARR